MIITVIFRNYVFANVLSYIPENIKEVGHHSKNDYAVYF